MHQLSFLILFFYCLTTVFTSSLSDWDFTGLERDSFYIYDDAESYEFRTNFRKVLPVDSAKNCAFVDCILEEYPREQSGYCWCYGNISTEAVNIYDDDSGIDFIYTSNFSVFRTTVWSLLCADDLHFTMDTSVALTAHVIVYAPQGCKVKPNESKGFTVGFGLIFLLVLAVSVVLYIAVGILVQQVVFQKKGWRINPFFFVPLIKDGVISLTLCVRRKHVGYDTLS